MMFGTESPPILVRIPPATIGTTIVGMVERAVMDVNPVARSSSLRELAMMTFSTPLVQKYAKEERAVATDIHVQSLA